MYSPTSPWPPWLFVLLKFLNANKKSNQDVSSPWEPCLCSSILRWIYIWCQFLQSHVFVQEDGDIYGISSSRAMSLFKKMVIYMASAPPELCLCSSILRW